jgi:peptide-methionine (R)-S-oxide reductase
MQLTESVDPMTQSTFTRRTVLASTTLLATGFGLASRPLSAQSMADTSSEDIAVYVPEESDFPYEVVRTEAEWREHLDNDDLAYDVLRRAKTEKPGTTDLWLAAYPGTYLCRGCDLPIYEGRWFQELDKGWVFFHHAVPQSVMFALDGPVPQYGQAGMSLDEENAISEVHCRRCGSHVGHHLKVSGMFLHCINGTALKLA